MALSFSVAQCGLIHISLTAKLVYNVSLDTIFFALFHPFSPLFKPFLGRGGGKRDFGNQQTALRIQMSIPFQVVISFLVPVQVFWGFYSNKLVYTEKCRYNKMDVQN